jgi:actin-related protein 3
MGYSGNDWPTYTIPSAIADLAVTTKIHNRSTYDQVNYFIGDLAYQNSGSHVMANLLESGEIQNFQHMEKYWNRCFFDYLRCEPQEHNVVLTEPPMNSPENRETIAEIMFETFNVKGLHISVQACLALYGNWYDERQAGTSHLLGLSGCVVDSGDGVTHIIPVVNFLRLIGARLRVP